MLIPQQLLYRKLKNAEVKWIFLAWLNSNISGIIKSSQKIVMSDKPVCSPSKLCWDKCGAASAQPRNGSWVCTNSWLSPGKHSYLTAKHCMTYLGISGWFLHGCTQCILQTTSGIPFWRWLTGTRAVFSQFTAQEAGCEHGVQWNLQDCGLKRVTTKMSVENQL